MEVYLDGKDVSANAKGLFIRRSTDGTGNIPTTTISVNITNLPIGEYDFKVYGIEMVNIPQGSFWVGDGSSTYRFTDHTSSTPYFINSEDSISVGTTAGKMYSSSTYYRPVTMGGQFPKGYAEVYCMKYEITQGQLADFINMLTSDQNTNIGYKGSLYRHTFTGNWPVVVSTYPYRALGYTNWRTFLAYLDWSALRPMTELEYEKICRGPDYPVAGEYAWGSGVITIGAISSTGDGSTSETSSTTILAGGGIANISTNSASSATYATIKGPARVGFAAKAATDRLQSGATYYGVMDMTGNVLEMCVATTNTAAVSFTGNVGDGVLNVSPNAGYSNQGWPDAQHGIGASTQTTIIQRGGAWVYYYAYYGQISSRYLKNNNGTPYYYNGGRGVR